MKTKLRITTLIICVVFSLGIFAGCGKTESRPIQIATKPMTEQFIIGNMMEMLITQNTDYTVELTEGIGGGTGNIQPAMEKGDFDLYPEYTGTGWKDVLKKEETPDDDTLFEQLKQEYLDQYGFEWVGMYGFANMYGLAVREEIAETNSINTYSDLVAVAPGLVFGAEYDFYGRFDGFDGLAETYGFEFKDTKDLDIGLKYTAIESEEIDAMTIFTTDGQLASSGIKVLEDDKHFFPTYYAGTVVRSEALEEFPGLLDVLNMLEGQISTKEMQQMNYDVEVDGKEPKAVAEEFLKAKGLWKEVE